MIYGVLEPASTSSDGGEKHHIYILYIWQKPRPGKGDQFRMSLMTTYLKLFKSVFLTQPHGKWSNNQQENTFVTNQLSGHGFPLKFKMLSL